MQRLHFMFTKSTFQTLLVHLQSCSKLPFKPLSAMCKQLQNLSSIILSSSYSFLELCSLVYMKDLGNQPTMTNLRVWWSTIIHHIRVSHSAIIKWCIVQLQMDNIMNRHFTSERCCFILPTYLQSSSVTTHGHTLILTDYWGQHNTTVPWKSHHCKNNIR